MKYTPTPWEVFEPIIGIYAIGDAESRIADCITEANAAHIVKCVNLHDELISIVQELASLSIAPHDGFNTPTAKINELVVGSRIVLGKAGLKKKEANNA